jgi:Fur family ferric uptake transcriptional regulator
MSEDLAARLREQGLRLTPQRQLILRAVEELRHATPDEVLAHVRSQVSSVNASTVYRTLEVLEELGLVRHTHLSDRAPTYHSTLEHEHVHVVCRGCRKVVSYDPDLVAPVVAALGRDGFSMDVGHLAIFGLCADCSAAAGDPPPAT